MANQKTKGKGSDESYIGDYKNLKIAVALVDQEPCVKAGVHATICRPDLAQISYENDCAVKNR